MVFERLCIWGLYMSDKSSPKEAVNLLHGVWGGGYSGAARYQSTAGMFPWWFIEMVNVVRTLVRKPSGSLLTRAIGV